ncbi:MAG: hypothetical protein QOK30_75 [Nocardioidaceae bacterium]|nr:hypothetical protein [Nocardioidaceae bacterium]
MPTRRWIVAATLLPALVLSACTSTGSPAAHGPTQSPATSSVLSHHPRSSATHASAKPVRQPRTMRGTSAWKLTKPALDHQIEGYANPVSVRPGGTISVMVSTTAPHFRASAYRIGGYRGGTGRLVWSSKPAKGRSQPAPHLLAGTRTVVANWRASLTVPTAGFPPGFYLLKLTATSGYQSFVPFTVSSPTTEGKVVLVEPEMDWEAYNTWGGYSLYEAPPGHLRSWAVSFDRPNLAPGGNRFLYNIRPTVVLAERLGLPLAYESDVDVATRPALLHGARGYVSVGHDEYWTVPERRYVTRARDAGTNLAFLSSNTMYWRVRLAHRSTGPDRLMIGYKTDAATSDPLRNRRPAVTTARWRDPPAPDPENSLVGELYECYPVDQPYRVASPHWWGFRGTGVHLGSEFPHLVADEADRVYPVASTPRPLQVLSYLAYDCGGSPTSTESSYYTTPSGAGVIDFGTQRWSCALGKRCPGLPPEDDRFARQVMRNVLRAFARGPVGRTRPAVDNVTRFPLPTTNRVPAS